MSHRINLICVVILECLPALALCQESPEPRSILKKAIAAHGGKESITKRRRGIIRSIAKQISHAEEMTIVETFDLPEKWKKVYDWRAKGKRTVTTLLMIEGRYWEWNSGANSHERQDDGTLKSYFAIPLTMLNLLGDNVKLSVVKETNVQGTAAVGLRAVWDGGMADYYFDKKKGLLRRIDRRIEAKPGEFSDSRRVWSNYKEIDGVQLPYDYNDFFKSWDEKNYTRVATHVVNEIRILDKLPEDAFIRPPYKKKTE